MNEEDEIKLRYLRCPYCGGRVKSIWNLKTTGLVTCVEECDKGQYNMKVESCESVEEEDFMSEEELEDLMEGEHYE